MPKMQLVIVLFSFCFHLLVEANEIDVTNKIVVQKCCKIDEILVHSVCHFVNQTSHSRLNFEDDFQFKPEVLDYEIRVNMPRCGHLQEWAIYDSAHDKLILLADGTLRHYTDSRHPLNGDLSELTHFFDYNVGSYCVEKKLDGPRGNSSLFALVCVPDVGRAPWYESEYIIWQIFDCVLHIVSIFCYLTVAIVHFVLPQLRDLSGNIITSIAVCRVIGQSSDLARIFADYNDHVDLLIADIAIFVSLLGAYFWLSSLGFYLWKMFRSRNVFLRMTDGRKYCYYSYIVWSITLGMTVIALFSHFFLDTPVAYSSSIVGRKNPIGWLGMALFFCPIGFSILLDIYFYVTTLRIINHMSVYGRIHHKLKYCFDTYVKIFLVLSVSWMFFLMSWLPYNGMYYLYIVVNGLEAPIVLCICVLNERKVTFLLKKACCYEKCICPCCRPRPAPDYPEWGEEMMSMNL